MNDNLKTSIDVDATSASILLPNNIKFNITTPTTRREAVTISESNSNITVTEVNKTAKVEAVSVDEQMIVSIEEAEIVIENNNLISLMQSDDLASFIDNIKAVNKQTGEEVAYNVESSDNNIIITPESECSISFNINSRSIKPDCFIRKIGEVEYWFSFNDKMLYKIENGERKNMCSISISYAYQMPMMLTDTKFVYNHYLYELKDGVMNKLSPFQCYGMLVLDNVYLSHYESGTTSTIKVVEFDDNANSFTEKSSIAIKKHTSSYYYNIPTHLYEDEHYWYIATFNRFPYDQVTEEHTLSLKVSKTDFTVSKVDDLPYKEICVYKDDANSLVAKYEYYEDYSAYYWNYYINDKNMTLLTSDFYKVFKKVDDKLFLVTTNKFAQLEVSAYSYIVNTKNTVNNRNTFLGDFAMYYYTSMDDYFCFYSIEEGPYKYKYMDDEIKIRSITIDDINTTSTTGTVSSDSVAIKLDQKVVFNKNSIKDCHILNTDSSFYSYMITTTDGEGNVKSSPIRMWNGESAVIELIDKSQSYLTYIRFADTYLMSKPYKKVYLSSDTSRIATPNVFATEFSNNVIDVLDKKEVEFAIKQEVLEDFEGESKINWQKNQFTVVTAPVGSSKCMYVGKNKDYNNSNTHVEASFVADALNISFDYFVSTEPGYDFFRFYIDDEMLIEASGTSMTEFKTFSKELSEGEHEFKFIYNTDSSGYSGEDGFFIDNIHLTKVVPSDTVEAISVPMDLSLYDSFNCSINFKNLVSSYNTFDCKLMYSYDKSYWYDFVDSLPTRKTVYLKAIFTKTGTGKATFDDLIITRKVIATQLVTASSDLLRFVTKKSTSIAPTLRKTIKRFIKGSATNRKVEENQTKYSDTNRRVTKIGDILVDFDTNRKVSNSYSATFDAEKKVIKDFFKRSRTNRQVVDSAIKYNDLKRSSYKDYKEQSDLNRVVALPAITIVSTERKTSRNVKHKFDTNRKLDKFFNIESALDTLRRVTNRASYKADTQRYVERVARDIARIDTNRQVIANSAANSDLTRRIAKEVEKINSTVREVVHQLDIYAKTERQVMKLMTIEVDNKRQVVNSIDIDLDAVRQAYVDIETEATTKREVTNSAERLSETVREIVKEAVVRAKADTKRIVYKKAETNIDMFRNVSKSYISIVDAQREVIKTVELNDALERKVMKELIAYSDTYRDVDANVEDIKATLDIELELNKGSFRIIKQEFYKSVEIEVEEE